ncbi:uncharacterized protein LOC120337160 isoform X4 [Styela clava]
MVKSDCKDELDRHKPDTSWDANFPCNSYPENTTECVGPPTLKTTTTQPTTSANVETTSQSRTESLTLETSTTDKTEPFTVSNLETSTGTIDVISTSTELVDITEVTTTATSGEQMTTKIETSTATSGDQNTTKMDSSTATSDDQTSEIVDTSTADLTTDTAEKSTTTDGSTASPFLATTEGSITSNAIQMQSTEASTTSKSITSAQTDTTITNQYTEAMKTDEITTEPIVEISLTISTTATPTMIETTNLENAGVSTATSRPEMTESDIATPTPLSATPGILVTTTKESITTGIVDTTTESTVPFVASSTTTVTSQTPTAGTTSEKLLQTTFKPTSVSTTQLSIINEETTAVVTSLSTTVESTEDTNLTTELASTVAMTTDQTTVISEITTLIKTLSPEPTTMKDMTIIFPTTNPPVTITETKSTSVTSPTPVTSSVTTHTASLSTVQLTTTEGMISSTAPILVATYTTSSPTDELSTVGEINEQSTGIETTSTLGTTEVQTTTRNTVEQIFSSPATNISVTEEAPATAPFSTETSAISQEILSVTTQTSTDVIEGQTTEENEAPTISIDSESVAAEITSLVATTSKPFSTDTSAISRDILTVTSQVSSGVTEERIMTKTEPSTTSVNSESTTKSVTQTSPNTLDIASTQQQSSNSEIMESTTTNQSEVEKQTSKPNDTTSLPAITENTTLYPSSIATSSTSTTEEDIETSMATTSSIMNDIATFSRDDTQAITTANVEFLRTTSSGSQTTQTTPLVNETNKANDFSSTSLTGQTQTTKPLDTTSTNEITSVFSGTEQMSFATADITGSETSAVFNTTVQGNVNNSSASSTTKELQTDFTVNSSTTRNTESTTEESSTLSMVLSTTNGEKETTSLQPDATTRILLETTTSGPTSATSNFTTSLISDSSGINTETSRLSTSTNSSSTTELMTRLGYVITAVSESRETVSTAEANTIETLVEVTSSSGSSQSMFPTTTLFEALTQNSTLSTFSPSEIELTYTQNNITKFAELTTTNVKETTDSSMTSETTLPQENATQANLEFTRLDNNSSPQFNTEGDFASTITSASNEIAQNSVTNTILSGTTANPPSDLTSSQYNTMEVTDTTTSSSENTTNLVSASETGRAIIDSVTKLPEISTSTFVVTSQEQTSSKDSTEQSNLVEALVEETSRTTSTPAISETIFASTEQSSSATSSFSIQTTSKSDTTEVVELSTTENIQITVTQAIGTEAFIDTNSTVISDITIRTTNTVSIIPETMKSDNTTIIDVVLQSTTTVPTVSDRSTIESTSMAATNSLQVDNSTSDVPFTSVAESTSNVFATSGTDIAPTSTVIPSTLPSSSELPLKQNSTSANTTVIANDTSLLGGSRPIEITSESNSVGTWTHSTSSSPIAQTTESQLSVSQPIPSSVPVRNNTACSSEKTGTDPSGYILWPTTNSGSVAVSSCPTPTSKTATRVCNSSNWGAPDTSACTQLSPRSRELQDIDRTTIVAGNAATLANQILNVTSNEKDSLVAYDLQLVSNILLKVVNVIGEENNYDITSDVINSVSNVIEAPSEELRVASQEFSSNSRLVQVIDNVLLKLEVLTDQNVYLDSKNVKVAVAGISGNQTFTGKSFTLSSNLQPGISDGTDSGDNSGQASVFIPPSIREKVTSSFTRIQFAVYTSTALFNHVRVDDGTVPGLGSNMNVSVYSDHVVSASVGNTKITGLSENVTITISRSNSYYGKGPHCVFYNFPNNGGEGSWSAEGCHLNPVSTSTTTICDCNHLTNFAVIMDVYGTVEYFNEYQNMILQILTYIGCSLSIFGLLCTLISYLMFEKLRKEVPAKILICLCAALITVNIVYLCLQSAYYSSHTTCVAIAAIMHYALLSSLMWMGLEAINMYIALVKVFNTYYRKYMLKMSLAGWGVPLLIVLIAFIVQFATGIPSYEMNSKTEICWLRKDVFYGTLVAPFAIVFLLNSVIYCLVLAQLLGMSSRKLKHLDSARKLKKPAKRENFRKLRGAIGLMALLGISWGFALGTFDKAALTFAYVFVVFNSSQGFWVFIFHCVLKKEVSKCWKKLIFNKGTFRDGSSRWSRFSSSNTRGSRSTTTSSARSMSASSIRTSYLVPKPSKSVDRSEASIGMDSKGLDVVTRTNSTANPVFDDPDIGPPPPFPPPPIPTEERIVRRVPRRTSPQPSTTISTQTDINLLHSSDTDSQNSMESMENSRQDEQNMEDEERRDSVNNNFGLPGIQGFQFPDHREVVISPSNESGIYSDASVSSTAILVEMPTYMDLESNNNEVSALRNNDVRGHHSGEINLGYEDDTLDDVTIISNDVTLINSGVKDNVDIVERHGGVNSRPHQRYAVKETKSDSTPGTPRIKGTNSLTDDARNTDSGISISSDATGAGSSTAGSTRSDRPELVTQDSRSSLYSVNSNTSSASGPSSGSESSYQIGRVRDRESSGDLPSPHLWKAPLVIKRSDDHTKANKKEGIFRRKPVITGPNNNGSTKRALWKRSRNNSKDNSTEKQSMNSFPPKRKLKRQPNKSENCDKSEGATNKLDIQMTNFSLNRGSFHDGAL